MHGPANLSGATILKIVAVIKIPARKDKEISHRINPRMIKYMPPTISPRPNVEPIPPSVLP
jgi:hypothetical protein